MSAVNNLFTSRHRPLCIQLYVATRARNRDSNTRAHAPARPGDLLLRAPALRKPSYEARPSNDPETIRATAERPRPDADRAPIVSRTRQPSDSRATAERQQSSDSRAIKNRMCVLATAYRTVDHASASSDALYRLRMGTQAAASAHDVARPRRLEFADLFQAKTAVGITMSSILIVDATLHTWHTLGR